MNFLKSVLGNKTKKETNNSSNDKHAEMIQLLSERNDSSIPTIKMYLKECLQGLLELPYSKLFSLKNKYSVAKLFVYENEIYQFINQTEKFLRKQNELTFHLIATPNSSISLAIFEYLVKQGIDKAEMACITSDMGIEDENNIFNSAKNGKCRILISDSYRLDSKLHLQNLPMKTAMITLFDPELMTALQLERVFEIMDWTKKPKDLGFTIDILLLFSTVNARESEYLRSEAKELDDPWNLDIILDSFFEAIRENDCAELNRIINILPYQTDPSAIWELLESGIKHLTPVFRLWYLNRKWKR